MLITLWILCENSSQLSGEVHASVGVSRLGKIANGLPEYCHAEDDASDKDRTH